MGKDLISRDALERIIKRAAELQAGEREIGEGLTTNEVLALGKDVGIPDRYLRQAILEEQTRIVPDVATGTWAWLTGPRSIVAHRVVPGERAAVERELSRWIPTKSCSSPNGVSPTGRPGSPRRARSHRFSARSRESDGTRWRAPRSSPGRSSSSSPDSVSYASRRTSGRSARSGFRGPPSSLYWAGA